MINELTAHVGRNYVASAHQAHGEVAGRKRIGDRHIHSRCLLAGSLSPDPAHVGGFLTVISLLLKLDQVQLLTAQKDLERHRGGEGRVCILG